VLFPAAAVLSGAASLLLVSAAVWLVRDDAWNWLELRLQALTSRSCLLLPDAVCSRCLFRFQLSALLAVCVEVQVLWSVRVSVTRCVSLQGASRAGRLSIW
jgi:hypothetical protein